MIKGWGVPGILLLLVLVLRPHMAGDAYPFSQGLLLIPVLVGLALLLLSPKKMPGYGKGTLPLILLPWILFTWSLITTIWSPDPGQGVRENAALLGSLAAFTMVFLLIREEKRFRSMAVPVLGAVLVPVIASSLYQRAFGMARIRETLHQMEASGDEIADLALIIANGRVFAGFLNPNMLAGFLGIGICVSLDLLLASDGKRRSLFYALLLGGQGAVLVLTGSVGGTVVAVAMACGVVIVRRGVRVREALFAGSVILVLGIGLLAVRGGGFLLGPESSLVQRAGYMAAGVRMAMVHPLLGWGAGAGPGALMGFVAEGFRPVSDPHNFLIRAWISWGLPGLVILGLFLIRWTRMVTAPLIRTRSMVRPGYAGFVFGAGAFLCHSLLDMDFFVPETALFGWCVLGAAAGLAATGAPESGSGPMRPGGGARLVLGALCLAMVMPVFVFLQGESLAFRAGKAREQGDLATSTRLYGEARGLLPMNGRFALEEGRTRAAAGQWVQAKGLFMEADSLMRASPYPSWEMGRSAQAMGDWRGSVPDLQRALSRYGTSPRIRIDLARAYMKLGDAGRVSTLLREARRLSIFDPQARDFADRTLTEMGR